MTAHDTAVDETVRRAADAIGAAWIETVEGMIGGYGALAESVGILAEAALGALRPGDALPGGLVVMRPGEVDAALKRLL